MLRSNSRVRQTGSPPLAETTQTAEFVAPRQALSCPAYAIRVPSGDHAGTLTGPMPPVRRRGTPSPSAATTQISVTLVRSAFGSGLAAYATERPSGDQAGFT